MPRKPKPPREAASHHRLWFLLAVLALLIIIGTWAL